MTYGTRVRAVAAVVLGAGLCASAAEAQDAAKGAPMPVAIQDGMAVQIDYTLTVDGQVVDTSDGKAPLRYVQGQGQIIPGLERQLVGLHAGDQTEVDVAPDDGYGAVDTEAFVEVPKAQLPPDLMPEVGGMVQGRSPEGAPFRATIQDVKPDSIVLDLNHPLAGKTLHFAVTVVDVSPAP